METGEVQWLYFNGEVRNGDSLTDIEEPVVVFIEPGIWYYYLAYRGADGKLISKIWERDRPENFDVFYQVLPTMWIKTEDYVVISVQEGSMQIDEYLELELIDPNQ
ncbi:hypothetical protein KQH40_00530 [bacterium]|nr:hypothetical protein [bacterium]